MPDYRIYRVDMDDRIVSEFNVCCANGWRHGRLKRCTDRQDGRDYQGRLRDGPGHRDLLRPARLAGRPDRAWLGGPCRCAPACDGVKVNQAREWRARGVRPRASARPRHDRAGALRNLLP